MCVSGHRINQAAALQCFPRGAGAQGWERSGLCRQLGPGSLNPPAPGSEQTVLNQVGRASHPPWPRAVPVFEDSGAIVPGPGFLKGAGVSQGLSVCEGQCPARPDSSRRGGRWCYRAAPYERGEDGPSTPIGCRASRRRAPPSSCTHRVVSRSPQTDLAQPPVVPACAWKARPLPAFYQMGCRGAEGSTCFL